MFPCLAHTSIPPLLAAFLVGASRLGALEEPLTLERAVQVALDRNNELERLENQVILSGTYLDQARARFHPDLILSVASTERFGSTFDQSIGQVENERSESLSLRASSNLTLFNGFANQATLAATRFDLASNEQILEQTRQRVAYETTARFLSVFAADTLIRVEEANIFAQRQQRERIRAYWEQGMRSQADLLQQEAALASAELRLINAQQRRALAELRLKEILQLDGVEELALVGPELTDLESSPVDYSPGALIEEALERRADLESQRLRIAATEQEVRQARAGLLPTLSLSVSGGTSYSSLNRLSRFSDQFFDLNPSATVGLNLSIPLFDRAQTKSSVTRAQVQLKNEQLTLANLVQNTSLALQQTLLDYRSALNRWTATQAQQTAAAEALAAMEARYHTGAATFVELSQTRAQYVEAQGNRVEALYEVILSRLAVDFNRGGNAWQHALSTLSP